MNSITTVLKRAINGLLMSSESEYPFKIITWKSTILNIATLLKNTGHPQGTPVKIVEVDDFFKNSVSEEDWHENKEKATVKKFQNLVKVLKTNLTNLKVYKIGSQEIQVYIVGNTSNGIVGISTTIIET